MVAKSVPGRAPRAIKLPANPTRLIEGLRDTGYQFNTALADIVDNSIAADARHVDVAILMDLAGTIEVHVADDGCGMSFDQLLNAMTYGSDARDDGKSLGKFGLGLKTASTACCRYLSVVSRSKKSGELSKLVWDLEHVAKVGDWEVLDFEATKEDAERLNRIAADGPGTLVSWTECDRVLRQDYQNPAGKPARTAFEKLVKSFERHASATYQRFLDPDDPRTQDVLLTVNGSKLGPWDPFCTWTDETELVAEKIGDATLPDETTATFEIKAYVVPPKDQVPPEDQDRLEISNENQGIFVYRENRLIHHGDWLGMYRKEPHMSLLRVEFSFDHKLDEAFNVDIRKSQVLLNQTLYDWLKKSFLPAPRRAAHDRYRANEHSKTGKKAQGAHQASNNAISALEEQLHRAEITVENADTGQVEVTNAKGKVRLNMPVEEIAPDNLIVEPVEGIDDGLLWEPAVIAQKHGLKVNILHPYYLKVYVPNIGSSTTVRGLDSLLWALSEAELGSVTDSTKRYFRDLRYEVSKLLRELVETMPDPDLGDTAESDDLDDVNGSIRVDYLEDSIEDFDATLD